MVWPNTFVLYMQWVWYGQFATTNFLLDFSFLFPFTFAVRVCHSPHELISGDVAAKGFICNGAARAVPHYPLWAPLHCMTCMYLLPLVNFGQILQKSIICLSRGAAFNLFIHYTVFFSLLIKCYPSLIIKRCLLVVGNRHARKYIACTSWPCSLLFVGKVHEIVYFNYATICALASILQSSLSV